MKYTATILLNIVLILALASCHSGTSKQLSTHSSPTDTLHYATGFSIAEKTDYKEVIVYSPWEKGSVYAKYYLVENNDVEVPADGVKVKVPLQTLATTSVTHLEFLSLLDEISSVTGVSSPGLIYNQAVRQRVSDGKTADLGDAFSLNVEKVLALKPEALMVSGYNQVDANEKRIQQAGVPVVYNNEWMETSLLGRAEWIKFVAVFYDKSGQADSVFDEIESRYLDIKEKANRATAKPKIMTGSNFRGTWYVPAGRSYMGLLFQDAGGDYFYANDTTTGSLPLNVELVLKNFIDTDVWLNCNFNTVKELIDADGKHALFRPVKENRVYNFNKRMLPSTANDFWESAVAHPDLILGDVVAVLHPEIMPGWEFVYVNQLTP